jgi:hypothetical protein
VRSIERALESGGIVGGRVPCCAEIPDAQLSRRDFMIMHGSISNTWRAHDANQTSRSTHGENSPSRRNALVIKRHWYSSGLRE